MQWIFWAVAVFFSFLLYDYYFLRGRRGWVRFWGVMLLAAMALPWPYFVPGEWPVVRFIFGMLVFLKIMKSADLAYGRVSDPNMVVSFPRYIVWNLIGPDCCWPKTQGEAKETRRAGQKRILRSLLKACLLLSLIALADIFPQFQENYILQTLWFLFAIYLFASGVIDMATGLMMQTGIAIQEAFNAPFLARSPRDFWGRRWNLYFRNAAHRNLFEPVGGKTRPVLAATLVFFVSALLHEYLVFICVGGLMLGYMSIFFALSGMATLAESFFLKKRGKKAIFPVPLAILLHTVWMIILGPFLIEPLLLVLPARQCFF